MVHGHLHMVEEVSLASLTVETLRRRIRMMFKLRNLFYLRCENAYSGNYFIWICEVCVAGFADVNLIDSIIILEVKKTHLVNRTIRFDCKGYTLLTSYLKQTQIK